MKLTPIALTLVLTASAAQARPALPDARSDLHTLARTLVGEADWHTADYAPISYVLWRRYRRRADTLEGIAFGDYVRMYSAIWKSRQYRASTIRLLPWAAHAGPWGGSRWDRVRAWVTRWSRGEVKDPCPNAMHFGGDMDAPRYGWEPVDCGGTENIFYRVDRMRRRNRGAM